MIHAFFAWWFGQLGDLLPSWLRDPTPASADAVVIAPLGRLENVSEIVVWSRRKGRETRMGQFRCSAAGLQELPTLGSRPVVLRLARAETLEKILALPPAAQRELDQVLRFEMDRETPFTADEVYWNHRIDSIDRQSGQLSVRLLLIPKAKLAPLLAVLEQSGIVPKWAETANDDDNTRYLPLGSNGESLESRGSRLRWPAAVCFALLGLGAVVTPFVRQALQRAAIDREISITRPIVDKAEKLRREIKLLSGGAELVDNERKKAGRPLEVLAAVTKVLPDDTFLTDLELRQQKITLSGRSGGAARLIGALAGNGMFRSPAFAAPVTRVEALRAEVFTIESDVGPKP